MFRLPLPLLALLVVALLAVPLALLTLSRSGDAGATTVFTDIGPIFFESVAYVEPTFVVAGGHTVGGKSFDIIRRFDGAGREVPTEAHLPTPRYDMATATDGRHVYLFGGYDGRILDEILRYDPLEDHLTTLPVRLPIPIVSADATFDGRYIYVVGGAAKLGGWQDQDTILRFDPVTSKLENLGGLLPSPRTAAAVFWDGAFVVVAGGCTRSCTVTFDEIYRYNPANGVGHVSGRLPYPRGGIGATFDGQRGHLFGGATNLGVFTDQILVYHPHPGTVTVDRATLPTPRGDGEAAFAHGTSYYFGGNSNGVIKGEVLAHKA